MAGVLECFRVFYTALLYSHRVYGWRVRVFSCILYSITLVTEYMAGALECFRVFFSSITPVTEYMAGVSECFRIFYTALLYSHRVYGWRVRVFSYFLYSITL